MAACPGLPGSDATRMAKPIWILLKQEIVSGSSISWTICKSASRSRQITMPAPHHSFFTGWMPFLPPNQQHWRKYIVRYHINTQQNARQNCCVTIIRQWTCISFFLHTPHTLWSQFSSHHKENNLQLLTLYILMSVRHSLIKKTKILFKSYKIQVKPYANVFTWTRRLVHLHVHYFLWSTVWMHYFVVKNCTLHCITTISAFT